MTDTVKVLIAAAVACTGPLAPRIDAQRKDFIGAEACRPCHSSQYARQSATGHARALRRVMEHPLAARFTTTEPLLRPPNFHFSFVTADERLHVRADDGRFVTELPIEWAFGAGEHAVTFVSRVSDEFYLEHSLSYYPGAGTFALTPRHDALPATTLNQAMGQPIRTRATIAGCFGCHATGPVLVATGGVMTVTEPGVHCERCHGAGGGHRSAAAAGDTDGARKLIGKPGALSAADLNRFCGECHRNIASIADRGDFDWGSPWSVRHQPPYLARSRCFQLSGGALSCLTCHDPHDRVRRGDAAYYRSKCVACHQAEKHPPAKTCLAQKEPDCAGCHMPLVAAGANMSFKNHWIGIYPKGIALKPAR